MHIKFHAFRVYLVYIADFKHSFRGKDSSLGTEGIRTNIGPGWCSYYTLHLRVST